VASYLDRIVAAHRAAAAADERPLDALIEEAGGRPPGRDFAGALRVSALAVIAEIKRRSPSRGALAVDLDPAQLAKTYEEAGASCLSILTDEEFFAGSVDDLVAARAACERPVLRKDFTVSERDVCDTKLMGADAVLLIVAALDDLELMDLHRLALEIGLVAVVEVHDDAELDRALRVEPVVVGVNQRDLATFDVDGDRAARLAPRIPSGVVRVAESGVRTGADARRLRDAGYDAILVGESLVTAPDAGVALQKLLAAES
jgi:indole-3-glycerol phosphate synthase